MAVRGWNQKPDLGGYRDKVSTSGSFVYVLNQSFLLGKISSMEIWSWM